MQRCSKGHQPGSQDKDLESNLDLRHSEDKVEAKEKVSEKEKEHRRRNRVLDPSGQLYHHWSLVVSLAFLYNFWALSYRFAFQEINQSTLVLWFALDYTADFIYLLDILINCRTGYLEEGVLIRNNNKTRHHYQECTRFYLDCLCLLPLDILYLTLGFNSIVRCLRLVKIYKFWNFLDRTERHTNYPNVFRTCTLVHYILVIFHWNACLFHMISKKNILDIQNLYNISDSTCNGTFCQYLHAFYWSTLALTTVGDLPRPRNKAEYIYVIVELFFGLFLVATVLGHVSNIVTNVSAARKEFQARLDAVKTFMRMRRVSDKLQDKVIRWFDYLWITKKSSDEERSVACLPDRLKAEIAIHVHLDTLRRVDIFQNTEAGFLCELVLRLKLVLFSPGDYVCRKNEVGHEMYIVSRGHLEVLTENDTSVVATLRAGSYFGEISVLNVGLAGNKRTASVRSVGYSDLFCLNKQDLWDVLKNYPNAEVRIRARAEERLNKLDIGQPQQVKSTHKCTARGHRLRGGQLFSGEGLNQTAGVQWHQPRHNHCHLASSDHRTRVKLSRSLTDANQFRQKLDSEAHLSGSLNVVSSSSTSTNGSLGERLMSEPPEGGLGVGPHAMIQSGSLWADQTCLGGEQLSSDSLSGAPSSNPMRSYGHRPHRHTHRAPHRRDQCRRSCRRSRRHVHNGCLLARGGGGGGGDTLSHAWAPPDTSVPSCWYTHLHQLPSHHPHQQPMLPEPALRSQSPRPGLYCWLTAGQQPSSAGGDATPLLQVPLVASQLGCPSPVYSHAASFRSQRAPQRAHSRTSRLSAAGSLETAASSRHQPTTGTEPEATLKEPPTDAQWAEETS